jgi:hypothetical protein
MISPQLYPIRRVSFAAAFCTALAGLAVAADALPELQAGDVYQNARFGYSICYPGKLLIPQRESENGDGRKFLAKDGAELAVWGAYNVLDNTVAQQMQDSISGVQQDGGTVTYKTVKEDWFVISGELSGKIYYQKTVRHEDRFTTFRLTYSRDASARYDPIVRQLNNCLRD